MSAFFRPREVLAPRRLTTVRRAPDRFHSGAQPEKSASLKRRWFVIAIPRNPRGPSMQLSRLCRLLWLTCLTAVVGSPLRAQSGTETVLYNFNQPARGLGPSAGFICDAGNSMAPPPMAARPAGA